MKLSKRLQQINSMVEKDYEHIWDCCCDHGFLGAALLKRNAAPNIHFVDIVPELMAKLDKSLAEYFPASHSKIVKEETFNEFSSPNSGEGKKLTQKVQLNKPVQSKWFTHCIDVAVLPLTQYSGKHLVIIAGVGGDLMNDFITSIQQRYSALNIDFLLCPVHHQ